MGCGACVYACPEKNIRLVDIPELGLRPLIDEAKCRQCGKCVQVCPGIELSHKPFSEETIPELRNSWGPVLEVWEGYATETEIRYRGSSGGVATALALYSLENEHKGGVLQIGASSEYPWRNAAIFSKDRESLLNCAGSRYSPAAPCEKFDWIKQAKSDCVFIGKPCDVAALAKARNTDALLDRNVGLTISIFCAGTPASKGTEALLEVLKVEPEQIESLRYRGCGWPGMTTVSVKGDNGQTRQLSYEQSWGNILVKYGQFRCRLCPDSTGEFADIACGDPWYREVIPGEPGQSLVLVRTDKGREILQDAIKAGYVKLERVDANVVPRSQMSLQRRRCHLWGRMLAMRMMRIPVPRYKGFSLFRNWLSLPIIKKLRSLLGTFKRIFLRGWFRPLKNIVSDNNLQQSEGSDKSLIGVDGIKS